jgi:hypothetical protein
MCSHSLTYADGDINLGFQRDARMTYKTKASWAVAFDVYCYQVFASYERGFVVTQDSVERLCYEYTGATAELYASCQQALRGLLKAVLDVVE